MVAKSNKDNRTITVHRLADKSVDNKRKREKKRERERELYKTIRWRLNSIRLDNNSSLFKVPLESMSKACHKAATWPRHYIFLNYPSGMGNSADSYFKNKRGTERRNGRKGDKSEASASSVR